MGLIRHTLKTEPDNEHAEEIERLLKGILAEAEKPSRAKLIGEMLRSVAKLAKDSPGTLNLKIASAVMKELRYSFRLFYPHRYTPKITMFGSARTQPNTPLYKFSKQFAAEAVKRNFMIITGGGPGIMAAGNEGAAEKGFGLNIRLPMEQTPNPYVEPKQRLINYKYFFTRKLFLVKEACAFALFPGGFGTLDEAFEVFTLLHTGKGTLFPIVLLEPPGFGFWKSFTNFIDEVLVKGGYISPQDRSIYATFESNEAALDHIQKFYRNYHSMRFVANRVVIRLQHPPTAELLKRMNDEFGFLASSGKMEETKPLPEESNEPELMALPRVVFTFDKKDFGNLRKLIDLINEVNL